MVEKDESVMLTIRLPASTRDAFQAEMRSRNVTAADFVRGKIDEFLVSRVPKLGKADYKKIAEEYLSGNAGNFHFGLHTTDDSPLVAAIRSHLGQISEHDAKQVALNLAFDLDVMSRRVVLLEEATRKVRAAMEEGKLL